MADQHAAPDGIHPGQWRLDRVELVNWGTFHGHHVIEVPRAGFLLTGHSGSGKSSVVDAITAVLTPRVRASFNTAAADGTARGGDRSVLTYVRGAYSRVADEDSGEITTRYLRPPLDDSGRPKGSTWSGILLRYDDGAGRQAHLVKLFHAKRGASVPADVGELHLLTQEPLELLELQPFVQDGMKERDLKKARPEAFVHKQHARFAARFCRLLGVTGERATLLLHRTQSAKNLGSLDDLFRSFMLDEPETFDLADRAVDQFTELSEAHQAVVRAREQIAHLQPLEETAATYDAAVEEQEGIRRLAAALDDFTQGWKLELTCAARDRAAAVADRAEMEHDAGQAELTAAEERVRTARAAVDARGGARLQGLEETIAARGERLAAVEQQRDQLAARLESVGLPMPEDAQEMAQLRRSAAQELAAQEQAAQGDGASEEQALRTRAEELHERRAAVRREIDQVQGELEVMKHSRSNVGRRLLVARSRIAEAVGLPESALPFAAELMQVRAEHREWTGAVERVLRPLSTVLLVPAAHEFAVTAAVDAQHLGTRVRIECLPAESPAPARPATEDSLIYRVEVAESASASVRDWLHHELARRFDYPCVETAEQLARLERGVTRAGQVRRGRRSYEKDDTFRVDDRSRWILGFSNEEKTELYLERRRELESELGELDEQLGAVLRRQQSHQARLQVLQEIDGVDWSRIDVEARRRELEEVEQARAMLLADDGDLRAAQHRLAEAEQSRTAAGEAERAASRELAGAQSEHEALVRAADDLQAREIPEVPAAVQEQLRAEFATHRTRRSVTHESIEADARKVTDALHARMREAAGREARAARRITEIILGFRSRWPAVAGDLSAELEARSGYLEILGSLRADRLPDFEHRFLQMLRDQSQQNIGLLAERIRSAPREIRRRVGPINESLLRSEFAAGRHLQIQVEAARPTVVQEFLTDLNTVTTGALAVEEDAGEAERRFQVLARLMHRLGSSEPADATWRRHCLDTRRHVRFLGLEQDADGAVVDWYDSGQGRSGGQKQKLVIFCLAAALRYQLTRETDETPRYGSIVMDEAFDKADAQFTRMALDIFAAFGFHMILATPLKMLQVIEDYVGGMAVISSADGTRSVAAPVTYEQAEETGKRSGTAEVDGGDSGSSGDGGDDDGGTLFEVDA